MNTPRFNDDGTRRYASVFVDAYSLIDTTRPEHVHEHANVDVVIFASGAADVRINGQQLHTIDEARGVVACA